MKTPPILLGAALVFWGWQTGYWVPAVIMAGLLEFSRYSTRRWDLSPKEFNRISDLCAVIFLLMLVYRFLASTQSAARWVPMALFPLVAAQSWSTAKGVDLGAIFWSFRKQAQKNPDAPRRLLDLAWPYFALIILAASAGNMRTPGFFIGLFVLCAWALWPFRPKGASLVLWALVVLAAGGGGYIGQIHLHRLHMYVQDKAVDWFTDFSTKDPFKSTTAFGEIGSIQLSDRILFRVEMEKGRAVSFLMREAVYNHFRANNWFSSRSGMKPVMPSVGHAWDLGPRSDPERSIIVSHSLEDGKGLLKLPTGAFRIENLPVVQMAESPTGAVQVEDGPGFVSYRVRYGNQSSIPGPPEDRDLDVPKKLKSTVDQIRDEWGLAGLEPEQAMETISNRFKREYSYTLDLAKKEPPRNPVAHFLLDRKAGHCEYFATATVMLLRSAGIPARYATGYLANDYSRFEKRFIVRSRDAHAWALVYADGTWKDLDTTPAVWVETVQSRASGWEKIKDAFSWLGFQFSRWRWSDSETPAAKYVWLLLIPLAAILAYRLKGRKWSKKDTSGTGIDSDAPVETSGNDSEFYTIEKTLALQGHPRMEWESQAVWLDRIGESGLSSLLNLHNRLRFDPKGLSPKERRELAQGVAEWLAARPTMNNEPVNLS